MSDLQRRYLPPVFYELSKSGGSIIDFGYLADINNDKFNEKVYDRAKNSLAFLQNCIDKNNGFLPNTGAND